MSKTLKQVAEFAGIRVFADPAMEPGTAILGYPNKDGSWKPGAVKVVNTTPPKADNP